MLALQRFAPVRFSSGARANPIGPRPGTVYTDVGTTHITTQHGEAGSPLVYDGYRFSGACYGDTPENGILLISHQTAYAGGCHDITFRNCWFNVSSTPNANLVHIWDGGVLGEAMHDITFDHCHFCAAPRMAFECNERRADHSPSHATGDYPGAYNISLTNSYFEVCGAEPISFDNNDPNHVYNSQDYGGGLHTVSGNYVEGSDGSFGTWPYTIEFNRVPHVVCANNFLGPAPGMIVNTRCTAGDSHQANMDWVFSGNTLDDTAVIAGHTYGAWGGSGKLWMCGNITGGVTVSDTMIGPPPFSPTSNWGYFEAATNMNFSGSTLHDYASNVPSYASGGSLSQLPTLV